MAKKKVEEKPTVEELISEMAASFAHIAESVSSMEQSLADIAAAVVEDELEEPEDEVDDRSRDKTLD